MEPQIQYVRSADGTNIAYTVMGEGVPMIFAPNIYCHLEIQLSGKVGEAWQQMAGEGIMVVPYDVRGFGMSDRDVQDFSLESQMADIQALREHLSLDRFELFGNIHSAPACIAYAASHPEQVTHLIVSMPFARGDEWYRAWPTLQGLESFRALGDEQWELYTLTHATALSALIPGSDAHFMADLMRECTTPDTLRKYFTELRTQDVSSLLCDVRSPSLVFERLSPAGAKAGERLYRAVAAGIPGARLVTVQAHFEVPSLEEARIATEFILGRAVEWPSTSARAERAEGPSGTAIILFADIVDSTALTERLGDAAFRAKARDLDAALRTAIRDNAGTPIEGKLLGDGVLAVFTSAREAIEGAIRCRDEGRHAGLPLHLGIHAGDVIREKDPDGRDNVYGGAVNIASRIAGLSAAGEVLVSETVRSLARTSAGVGFEDRGEQELKGVGEKVRVWAVAEAANQQTDKPANQGNG
jgi:class 3 adenylate cyclase/pimeloyl-ACP methyl ester carboxylesterase